MATMKMPITIATMSDHLFEESGLAVAIDRPSLRYDGDEGPGKQTRVCARKEADIIVQPQENEMIIIEVKKAEWFGDFFENDNDKVCDLYNTIFDTYSGLALINPDFVKPIDMSQIDTVKALFLINQTLRPDEWDAVNNRIKTLLRNKFKKTKVKYIIEHESGRFGDWIDWLHIGKSLSK